MLYFSVNGQPVANISIQDRGLAYGDGLFTTAKIANGTVEQLQKHILRLQSGCKTLGIKLPELQPLFDEIDIVGRRFPNAVLKIVITAGQGGRGYSRVGVSEHNIIVMVSDFPKHYKQWAKSGIYLLDSKQQMGVNPMLSGLKHLNRLEQVLIRQELDNSDADDLVVCNVDGNVIETSCANIFWLKENEIFTPEITVSGVAGLMRKYILQRLPNIQRKKAHLSDLANASSIFISNSIMGIVPVKQYNNRVYDLSPVFKIQKKIAGHLSD